MVQRGDAHCVFGQVGVVRLVEEAAARGAVVNLGHGHFPSRNRLKPSMRISLVL
jgi:hypothetical protein